MARLMRAVRVREFGGPSVLELCSDAPVPHPGQRQVLIRVRACGVNPVETYIRSGAYSRKPSLPYTPGTDVSGVVEEVGGGVSALKAGDRVFTTATETGGYAEFTLAAEDCVHPLPASLDYTQGAALGVPYCTAYRALFQRAQAKAGETVLIHGASGGVGVAACQLARGRGLRVLGTAGTVEGLELVLNNQAHLAFNHLEPGYTSKIMEATGGRGVDVIVEMLANVNLSSDLQMLAYGGRVTVTFPHVLLALEEHVLEELEEHVLEELEEHVLEELEEHVLVELEEHVLVELEEHVLVELEEHVLVELEKCVL